MKKKPGQTDKLKIDFQVFVKPVGNACNMACSYCYYSPGHPSDPSPGRLSGHFSGHLPGDSFGKPVSGNIGRMSDEVLEIYIQSHIQAHPGPVVRFSWHGGEPLLAGIDFFEKAAALQKKYQPRGVMVQNGIQTNGTLVDEDWCRFFKKEGFSVGLSLDGPKHLHDRYRITRSGRGSHSRVMRGLTLLQEHRVPCDILCVVHDHNVDHPLEVYEFLKQNNAAYIGFLPVVNSPAGSVDPEKYGEFLCTVFDRWKARDIGRIKVQIFEEVAAKALGLDHALCIFRRTCGEIPVVEMNGDVYPCDHFVRPDFKLGSLKTTHFGKLMHLQSMGAFGRRKKINLPGRCRTCKVLAFCNGGCPKDRITDTTDSSGSSGKLNHLCPGYKRFFTHCLPFVEQLEQMDQTRKKKTGPVKTGRNSPCPCGSGKKFKHCCMIH